MYKRQLVIGAAASGKSAYAESLCLGHDGPRVYLATMEPFGEEGARRIARHRALREGKGFSTLERTREVGAAVPGLPRGCTLLLEDVGNLVANELFAEGGLSPRDPDAAAREVLGGIERLAQAAAYTVVVTVDVFADGMRYDEGTEAWRRALARVNAGVAALADRAVEVVYGIPVWMKGEMCIRDSVRGVWAVDTWARCAGLAVSNPEAIKRVSARLLSGGRVALYSDMPISGQPPEGVDIASDRARADIVVSPFAGANAGASVRAAETTGEVMPAGETGKPAGVRAQAPAPEPLRLVVPCIVAGIGCRRGACAEAIEEAFLLACGQAGISPSAVREAATIDVKAHEDVYKRQVATDSSMVPL